jgi:hypothetical protein
MQHDLRNKGSLITIGDENQCLGYLLDFTSSGKGIFDATLGLVDVTPGEAHAHNEALDKAMLDGLDTTCEIGQGTMFFLSGGHERRPDWATTFLGTQVGRVELDWRTKATYVLHRGDKTFRGTLRKNGDNVFFRRVS